MQSYLKGSTPSLISLTKDFILKKRTIPNKGPQIQIFQNEIQIKNTYTTPKTWKPFEHQDFKQVLDEMTKKINIYKIKGFDSLSLSFISCENLTNDSMKYLKQILIRHFPNLKCLSLNFYGDSQISKAGTEQIAQLISSFATLRSLQIRIVASHSVSDDVTKLLVKRIHQSQKYLKSLHLDFSRRLEHPDADIQPTRSDLYERLSYTSHANSYCSYSSDLSTEGIIQVNFAITKYFHHTLQDLTLNFAYIKSFTDKVCLQLGQRILEQMESLKRLNINFCGCQNLTDGAMALFNQTSSKRRLKALEELTLDFAELRIKDEGLKLLEEGVVLQFKDLKKLVVNLMSIRGITDDGYKSFNANVTKNLTFLQSFTLACCWCNGMGRKSFPVISKDIADNLKNLRQLCLMFSKMDEEVLSTICSHFENSPAKLEKLNLLLSTGPSKTPLILEKFTNSLKTPTFKDLRELKLDLTASKCVNNETVMELGYSLQSLEKLKILSLDFTGCDFIGQKGASFSLVPLIPKNVFLETFELFLTKCIRIDNELLDEFTTKLCELQKRLGSLYLNFSWCPLITDEGLEKLCNGIQRDLKELNHLTLNFYQCKKISSDVKTEMKPILKEVPIFILY